MFNAMIRRALKRSIAHLGYEIRKKDSDFYLHEYDSYEHYKEIQVFYNKQKIEGIFADEKTLDLVTERVIQEFGETKRLFAICHGTRNGFEQNYLTKKMSVDVVGTDISETAINFPKSIQWDFHDQKEEWLNKCDFIYTNSLDQSWKPTLAVATWLNQLTIGGLLFIEHTELHGPQGASEMDPFGVKPEYMPYLLSEWFGHRISIEVIKSVKSNINGVVWLFVVKKLINN